MIAPQLPDISPNAIEAAITESLTQVLDTMVQEKVTFQGAIAAGLLQSLATEFSAGRLVASVGFIGDVNGMVHIYLDESLAELIACRMLGMNNTQVRTNHVLGDATGELANMITGVFKNILGELGYVSKLTLPSIIKGNHFTVEHMVRQDSARYVFRFACAGLPLITDIIVQKA